MTQLARNASAAKGPEELPPEGSEEEAQALAQRPVRMPSYELRRVQVADLQVDYAAPYGDGYARPLSAGRLRHLRREWDVMACAPLVISKHSDGSLWVIDGNHRRCIAFEKGISQLPAMVFSDLTREREADLYTKLGTVLGQTPWTRFQSKLIAGDAAAADILRIVDSHGLVLNATGYTDGQIQAVARLEWIYARAGAEGLDWTLGFLTQAFGGARDALGEMQLEGVFGFYARYADRVNRDQIATMLGAAGLNAWHDRAASIWQRVDVGRRSNTYGMAIADMVNDALRKQGMRPRELLPPWVPNLAQVSPGASRFRDVSFSDRTARAEHVPAPQHLGVKDEDRRRG